MDRALSIFGPDDSNLHHIESHFKVHAFVKRDHGSGAISLILRGPKKRIDNAVNYIADLERGERVEGRIARNESGPLDTSVEPWDPNAVYTAYDGRAIIPKTENQKNYVRAMASNDLVVGIGPAGTGKTFLAVAYALRCLKAKEVSRIVLTRPVVEAGEKLGFLPGDLYEKVYPYLKPLFDSFYTLLGPEKLKALQVTETIEIVPLAYMRGRTLENAFIILDEAQNTTQGQMKMFLTRMGQGSKIVVTGDITQVDLDNTKTSGLEISEQILGNLEGVAFVRLDQNDVVRHPLVKHVIKAYENWEESQTNSFAPRSPAASRTSP